MYAKTKFGPGKAAEAIYVTCGLSGSMLIASLINGTSPLDTRLPISPPELGAAISTALVVIPMAMLAESIGSIFSRRHTSSNQKKRDHRARRLFENLESGAPVGDYSFYLRALETTGPMHELDNTTKVQRQPDALRLASFFFPFGQNLRAQG